MRIHDIEIRNFRSIEHFRLTDIPDTGVVLIHGENEAGKSSVVEALQLLQNPKVKFDSNTAQLKSIQTAGKDEPIFISMRASVGPVTFRITKQYRKKSFAVLTIESPRRAEYKGREAEDQFRTLLAEHLDVQLSEALLVPQGEVNPVIQAAGIPTLGAALEELDGGASTGDDTALMKAVEDRYLQFYTQKGKPRGDLEKLKTELTQALTAREEAESAVAALEEDVLQIERETTRLAEFEAEIPQASKDLVARRAAHDAALQQQGELDKAAAVVTTAKVQLDAATTACEQRTLLREELAAATTEQATLHDALADLSEEQESHLQRLEAAKDREKKAAEEVTRLRELLLVARKNYELAQAAEELASVREILKDVDARTAQVKELRAAVPLEPLELARVEALAAAELELKLTEARVMAQAANVSFRASEPTDIEIDGAVVSLGEHSVALTGETAIRIGAVTATFTPAVGEKEQQEELVKAREAVAQLRKELGCESEEQARKQYDTEQRAIQAVAAAERERAAALAGRDETKLRETADQLARKLAERSTEQEPVHDVAEAKRAAEDLEAQQSEAERLLATAQESLVAEQSRNKEVDLRVQETLLTAANEKVERLQQQLESAVESDEALELALRQSREQFDAAEDALAQLRAELPDLKVVKGLLEGAEERLAGLQKAKHAAEINIEKRRGQITAAEGAAERLIQAREAAEAAQFRFDQVLSQAEAAALLRETLLRHRDAARRRYAEPFAEKLTSLAGVLYGGEVAFELDEGLDIEQRVLGNTSVGLGDLSGGAREQLGILTRFAVAELVAEQDGVPIFLDDALGYTDSERLARMNYLIGAMGKQHQVFVLTCMPSRYADVVGKRSFDIAELKAGQ